MILKDKTQKIIQILGLVGLVLGILTMLRTPTVIFSPWFLVLLFLPILIGVSFLLGLVTRLLSKSNWTKLTFTALFAGLFCVAFYISEYKPTRKITVSNSFSGQARLLLSKDDKDKFELNEYGIGYVSESTYRQGFKPRVEKNGKDITNEIIRSLSFGSMTNEAIDGKIIGPYSYLGFIVPGQSTDSSSSDLRELIDKNAIDTTRLIKE